MKTPSSRRLAQKWPYTRHKDFVNSLRNAASAWFASKKGVQTHSKMTYCLNSQMNWKHNMILPEVYDYIEKIRREKPKDDTFPIHKYIHHGLSSQAMVLNLIGPLIIKNDLIPLINVLKQKGINLPGSNYTAEFEFEDRNVFNEDTGQPTSIDLVLKDKLNKPRVFIESKLVETEFGICSVFSEGDCNGNNPVNDLNRCYLHFIGRTYWDKMKKHSFTAKISNESICIFALYYQFFREVLFSLEHGGFFVLLHDRRSPVFKHVVNNSEIGIMPFLMKFIPDNHKSQITDVTVQELVQEIEKHKQHQDWINQFRIKYGLE